MKKYLVIGNPIAHSLSPKLHNFWLRENNINAVYDKKQLNENNLKSIIPMGLFARLISIGVQLQVHISLPT